MGVLGALGVRRAPAAALLALAALLLLLLARLPPGAPARRPPPAPQPAAPSALPTQVNRTAVPVHSTPNSTAHQSPASEAQPPQPPPDKAELVKGKKASAEKEKKPPTEGPLPPGAVLTRDLYVAGHTRPHPELCPALGARLRLVILVSSAPSHAAAREAVRLTWGHAAQRTDVALGFVLGASPPQYRAALDREDALYGDIIEGRSVDSYSNLTLKTLSMLEWVDTYCPRAPRLLKTDDDMFINVNKLLLFAEAPGRRNATNTVWGKVARRSRPARAPRSKYFVPPAQYPGSVFPDFATGPAYLVTADAVPRLLRAAPTARYLRLEDVFVTGVLASRLGVRRVHAPEFYNKKVAPHPCAVQRGVAIHMVRYHEQFDLWRKLLDGKTKCAS
ncbi:beta-1,3-galactosyltransferase 5-like [Cydia pomonella]|uniref:beta-1,3-galactosyltransferase 5-like n=1 Tax=Cydia pomonella TaxID=82600 RepID=UPI002ADDD262|nr:beta-1,3-galactosyltransferase 5-like [Cydia pomonella]